MRIDLHTHSNRSDGTASPAGLVREAHAAGLDVVALTDHDTAEGWAEATEEARRVGITLVPGMEVSCQYDGAAVHLLAYLPDPTHQPFAAELARILDGRNARLPTTLARLRSVGVDLTIEDVMGLAGEAVAVGRPHVADALVVRGVVRDREEAFARFLGPRGPAYVHRYAAPLLDMLRLVAAAGGVSVLAHPWGRHSRRVLDEPAIAELAAAGLAGLEVDHEDHAPEHRDRLRAVAAELDLLVTGSSDHHGTGKAGHSLGCNTTAPEQFHRLLALAAEASARSGRRTPQVVAP